MDPEKAFYEWWNYTIDFPNGLTTVKNVISDDKERACLTAFQAGYNYAMNEKDEK